MFAEKNYFIYYWLPPLSSCVWRENNFSKIIKLSTRLYCKNEHSSQTPPPPLAASVITKEKKYISLTRVL